MNRHRVHDLPEGLPSSRRSLGAKAWAVLVWGAIALGGTLFPAGAVPNTPEGQTLAESKTPVIMAQEGKAEMGITISPESSEDVRSTAKQLAALLKRITGAEFAIAESTKPAGITLGTLKQFPDASLNGPLAIKDVYDGVEAFAIKSEDGNIRLLANSDLGVSHAAFRFLELLGCRWFFQGSAWEVVPSLKTLSFDLNEISRPDIWSRNIWFGRAKQAWEPNDPNGTDAFNAWAQANLMGDSLKVAISHRWHAIPGEYKEEFKDHPEYFALVDGKRTPPQFCVTNPGLQKAVIQYANDYFDQHPEADMVPFDPADQGGWCTCPDCQKLGHPSNQAFYLANLVGRALQKTHPGKFVGILAYSWHSDPPPFNLEPNVYVQLTAGMNASKYSFDELFDLWIAKCSHLGIYEYYSYWEMDKAMLPGTGVANNTTKLGERMKRYVDNHVNSISGQSANSWGVNGLGYYLALKLMWNASADVHALKRDFYEKAFGPAAPVMERYFERLNLANKPLPGAGLLRQCLADLEEATALAKGQPEAEGRLTALKENLVYNYIGQKVDNSEDAEGKKKNTLEWFTWAYRTRNNYMNDWITFRSAVGRPAAEEMKEPTWFWRLTKDNPSANPWRIDRPVTVEELEARLGAIKKELGEAPSLVSKEYSSDYVLVNFDRPAGVETKQIFSGSASYLLASKAGEPLRFRIAKRDTGPWEKPEAKYSLTTLSGEEIDAGKFDTGDHELALKVPHAGIYRFTCSRGGPGWNVTFPKELDNALVFELGGQCRPSTLGTLYFYVPKGTAQLILYAERGRAKVSNPGGKVVFDGPAEGKYISVPVASGADGQVWSIDGKLRNLWFFNVPTALSSSAQSVFIPREVAKNDGLKIALPQ
ncbi:hypothetical protein BH09VER1_BH09VER1_25380 [soil metagenome]